MRFQDRDDAGQRLTPMLMRYQQEDPLVLALPRGGVPVGRAVATALDAPLSVLVVRKLGVPWNPELGMGAIAEGGIAVIDEGIAARAGVGVDAIAAVVERERAELGRRIRAYRGGRPLPPVDGRTVIVVDDGIATGATARAAIRALRAQGARRIVLAAPVAARDTIASLREEADAVVCVHAPARLHAIGAWYDDFHQLQDDDVRGALASAPVPDGEEDVHVPCEGFHLAGTLGLPAAPRGVVLFAHGSGSSRHSPRNRVVARALRSAGYATLLLDLLTPHEEEVDTHNARLRFDIRLLSLRLVAAVDWLKHERRTRGLSIACFGASTGAAAALRAAVARPADVRAVICRGGRPDLAGEVLPRVACPVLLVVGGEDTEVLALNRAALDEIGSAGELAVVQGATHLFEEPGALREVIRLVTDWLERHPAAIPKPPAM